MLARKTDDGKLRPIGEDQRFAEAALFADSLREGDGFEPSVPGEGKPTHASATFDRYRRLSPAIRHLRLPTCGGSDSSRYGCGWHPVHR
jgi:hypothetical protein